MLFRLGHDDEFVGVTPGLLPIGPAEVRRMATREYRGPIAPAFVPPADVRPAVAGTIVDKKANPQDLAAMLVDLSLRGWYDIRPGAEKGEWTFVRPAASPFDALTAAEVALYDAVLGDDDERPLAVAKRELGARGRAIVAALYAQVTGEGYFHTDPGRWHPFGARRTATGNALRVQALGFKRYLETAEAEQIKVEEAEAIFNRYLPWAMAFGVTSQWSKLVAGVMARQQLADTATFGAAMVLDPDVLWLAMVLLDPADIAALGDVIAEGGAALFDAAGGLGQWVGGLGDLDLASGLGDLLQGAGDVVGGLGELAEGAGDVLGDLLGGLGDIFGGD